jgi:hypothetical protein
LKSQQSDASSGGRESLASSFINSGITTVAVNGFSTCAPHDQQCEGGVAGRANFEFEQKRDGRRRSRAKYPRCVAGPVELAAASDTSGEGTVIVAIFL